MIVQLHDRVTLKGASRLDARTGYLRADAVFSRVGIQEYYASELGLQDGDPGAIVRVYRPPEEVGKPESLASMKSIPMTDDHPTEDVTAVNWRRLATGWTGENVVFDGELTSGSVVLTDKGAIDKWNNGKKELSVGYACEIEWTAGSSPKGETYDAIQRNIFANHVAQVDAGRCGGACRISDGICQDCGQPAAGASCNCHREDDQMSGAAAVTASPTLVTRTVDGITIQVTDQGAQVIDKLLGQLTETRTAVTTAEQALAKAQDEHKKEIEKKDGEIAGLKTQIPDASKLDQLATERGTIITDVKKVMGKDYDPTGKSNLDMITDAVTKKLGAEGVKDKSEDFLRGVWATMRVEANGTSDDSVRHVVADGPSSRQSGEPTTAGVKVGDKVLHGRDAYLHRLKTGAVGAQSQQKDQ